MNLRILVALCVSMVATLLAGCEPTGVCVIRAGKGTADVDTCMFGTGYKIDKTHCDIQKGELRPYHAEDKGGEYGLGKETCMKLGYGSCGGGSCTIVKN